MSRKALPDPLKRYTTHSVIDPAIEVVRLGGGMGSWPNGEPAFSVTKNTAAVAAWLATQSSLVRYSLIFYILVYFFSVIFFRSAAEFAGFVSRAGLALDYFLFRFSLRALKSSRAELRD